MSKNANTMIVKYCFMKANKTIKPFVCMLTAKHG